MRPSSGDPRRTRALAWPLLALWAVLAMVSASLQLAVSEPVEAVLVGLLVVLAGVGALLMRRAPGNPIGLILMTLALLVTASTLTSGVYLRVEDSTPPTAVALLVWFDEWVIDLWFGLVAILLPLLFPDGHLPSRHWRPLLWLGLVVIGLGVVGSAFGTTRLEWNDNGSIANPLALGGAGGAALRQAATVSDVAFVPVLLGTLTAVAMRLRRSRGTERQQLKWFAYAIGMLLIGLAAAAVSELTGYEALGNAGWFVFLASLLIGMPLAIAVAILRHRLYDIDVVIKRTLVYGSLTLLLAATYLGLVLSLRVLLGTADGRVRPRRGRLHPRGGRSVPASARPGPAGRGPAILPPTVRRRPHRGGVLRPAAPGGRPRDGQCRPRRRRTRHHAARPRLAVAAECGMSSTGRSSQRFSQREAQVLAWGLCAVFVVEAVTTLSLVLSGSGTVDQGFVVVAVCFPVVGALIASREPENAVGWLLLAIAVAFGFQGLVDAYLGVPGRPAEVLVAWVSAWVWYVWLYLAGLILPLVFPDGRLLSARWRVAVWLAAAAFVLAVVSEGFVDGQLHTESARPIANPLGLDGWAGTLASAAGLVGQALAATGFVLAGVSLVLRLRASTGREQQQLKLFVYVATLALGGLVLATIVVVAGESVSEQPPTWALVLGASGWMTALLLIVVGLPLAVGTAILRHRLYDIDLVIKRTLVYGSLTLLLAATYLGLVLSLRVLLGPLTGESDLAVAASTLAVAGLFRPLRARVQQVVDRRFFRRRYDADRTVEAFVGQLRQEVDLEAVRADLGIVVRDTMQPVHLSLWLRGTR